MKTIKQLEKEALTRFNELLKAKPHVYDKSDRLGFILGYVGAEYELLRLKLERYEKERSI